LNEVKPSPRPDNWKRNHNYDNDKKRYRYDDDDDDNHRNKRRGFDLFDIFTETGAGSVTKTRIV
jgi:hypothetical protein